MRNIWIGLIVMAMLVVSACQKDDNKLTEDQELINAIKKASNKQMVGWLELPDLTKDVLDRDYSENDMDAAKLAPELGYEVDLRNAKGDKQEEMLQAYFNMSGRELIPMDKAKDGKGHDKGDYDGKTCFTLVYPLSYIMPDRTTITARDEATLNEAIKAWYNAHPDVIDKPVLVYPVDIKFKDGRVITVNNEVEMKEAYANCENDGDHDKPCFKWVFPLEFIVGDALVTINNYDELKAAKIRWKEQDVRPQLQFPVDVIVGDRMITLENREALKRLKDACDDGGKKPCFRIVLPVTYIMPDGSLITVENREDKGLIKRWYEAHPDYERGHSFQYPIEVVFKGETLEVNSDETMKRIKVACKDKRESCFYLLFPQTYVMPDGTTITLESKEDRAMIKRWYTAHPDVAEKPVLQFPVDIKWKDGNIQTIHSREELQAAKDSCDSDD